MATKVLGCFLIFGGPPSVDQIRTVLVDAGMETLALEADTSVTTYKEPGARRGAYHGRRGGMTECSLSEIAGSYARLRSFEAVAELYRVHRPEIRRSLKRAADTLLESDAPARQAVGAWFFSLVDKASPWGVGRSIRAQRKIHDSRTTDPDEIGEFRIQIKGRGDAFFEKLFSSRGNI
jgi:hypothetical protein